MQVHIVPERPNTQSGTIVRRPLRGVAAHRAVGDQRTVQDSTVISIIGSALPVAAPAPLPDGRR